LSRASLVETYIAALPLTAVTIVSSGRRCRITEGEPAEGEPSHAELVLMTIGQEGLSGKPPAALATLNDGRAPRGRRDKYRQAQMAKAEPPVPYSKFIERFTATMVRDVAISGRTI
jgi:hypothetical protein